MFWFEGRRLWVEKFWRKQVFVSIFHAFLFIQCFFQTKFTLFTLRDTLNQFKAITLNSNTVCDRTAIACEGKKNEVGWADDTTSLTIVASVTWVCIANCTRRKKPVSEEALGMTEENFNRHHSKHFSLKP